MDISPGTIPPSSTNGFHFSDPPRLKRETSDVSRSSPFRDSSPPKVPARHFASFIDHRPTTAHEVPRTPPAPPRRSRANSERFVQDALDDACDDFERTLLRSHSMRVATQPHQRRTLPNLRHDDDTAASVNITNITSTSTNGRPTWKLRSPVGAASGELDVSELGECRVH